MSYTKIERIEQIPKSITEYKCDICGAINQTEKEAMLHRGNKHSFVETVWILGADCWYIKTREDYENFCWAGNAHATHCGYTTWRGEGWYRKKWREWDDGGSYATMQHIDDYISELDEEMGDIRDKMLAAGKLRERKP